MAHKNGVISAACKILIKQKSKRVNSFRLKMSIFLGTIWTAAFHIKEKIMMSIGKTYSRRTVPIASVNMKPLKETRRLPEMLSKCVFSTNIFVIDLLALYPIECVCDERQWGKLFSNPILSSFCSQVRNEAQKERFEKFIAKFLLRHATLTDKLTTETKQSNRSDSRQKSRRTSIINPRSQNVRLVFSKGEPEHGSPAIPRKVVG